MSKGWYVVYHFCLFHPRDLSAVSILDFPLTILVQHFCETTVSLGPPNYFVPTGELYEGEWLYIGTPERLELLNAQLLNRY
jgi:hypothetical protein